MLDSPERQVYRLCWRLAAFKGNRGVEAALQLAPPERRNFKRIIVAESWLRVSFERTLTNRETWIIYMSDVLVTRIDEIFDGTGDLVQARYPS